MQNRKYLQVRRLINNQDGDVRAGGAAADLQCEWEREAE